MTAAAPATEPFAVAARSPRSGSDSTSGPGAEAGEGDVGLTPRDVIHRDGTTQLLRFRGPGQAGGAPVLLVPSLINRWYVLDLRPGASLVAALVAQGLDVYVLDWGAPDDDDRYLTWDEVLARLRRALRQVRKWSGRPHVGLLGYCMGATVAGIHAALESVACDDAQGRRLTSFVNLLGPFDFSHAGALGLMTDARWFDAGAIASAGNVAPPQMQAGFSAMRPTMALAKWVGVADRAGDPNAWASFAKLERWATDNVAFPGAAYATYVRELYQQNLLVRGEHRVGGQRVDLAHITCPVLTVCAARDTICPPDAATALNECCGATERTVLRVSGGHVGAVVGAKAARELYPAIGAFFARHSDRR